MTIFKQIKADRITAMKNRNVLARAILSSLVGDLETMSKNLGQDEPTDEQVIKKVKSFISNAESNQKLLAEKTDSDSYSKCLDFQYEIDLLTEYVPKQLDDDALRAAVKALITELGVSGKQAIGPVMKGLKDQYAGRFDGKRASEIVREETA